MARRAAVFSLIVASSAFAQPQITSVTPSSGPVTGATTVTIRGSGFDVEICPGPATLCGRVIFGSIDALSFRVLDSQTIEAVTPPSFPGVVNVGVVLLSRSAFVRDAFTYTGQISDAFERVLLPIFTPPVNGEFGSKFYSSAFLWNLIGTEIPAFGLAPPPCNFIPEGCPPPPGPPLTVFKAREGAPNGLFDLRGDPGYFIFVPKGAFDRMAASLRVADLSRSAESFGTRIPIVPERDFRNDFLALIDVPIAPRFRNTLRIYSLDPQTSVHIAVVRYDSTKIYSEFDVDLRDGVDMFHPIYAEVSRFGNVPPDNVRIEIEPRSRKRIWAFDSVTNNDTQQITIVAPH